MKREKMIVQKAVSQEIIRLNENDILNAILAHYSNFHRYSVDKIEFQSEKPFYQDILINVDRTITPKKLEAIIFLKDS